MTGGVAAATTSASGTGFVATGLDDVRGTAFTTAAQVTAGLAGKANTIHTHAIADITGLQAALDAKLATPSGFVANDILVQCFGG